MRFISKDRTERYFKCDGPGCKNTIPFRSSTPEGLIQLVKNHNRGWQFTDTGDYCPRCGHLANQTTH